MLSVKKDNLLKKAPGSVIWSNTEEEGDEEHEEDGKCEEDEDDEKLK